MKRTKNKGKGCTKEPAYSGKFMEEIAKELETLQFAKEREPVIGKVIYGGKTWEDVTELFVGW